MLRYTMTQRIKPVDPPYEEEVKEDFEALMPEGVEPLNLFRTVAHNPRVLHRMRVGGLLDEGAIEPREREIVILRTTANCGCEYEWGVHATGFSAAVGLSDEQAAATVHGDQDDSAWSETDSLLIQLADELHETAGVSDELWTELEDNWEPDQLIELVMLIGLYHAVSFTANAFEVELEDIAKRFPDDPDSTV